MQLPGLLLCFTCLCDCLHDHASSVTFFSLTRLAQCKSSANAFVNWPWFSVSGPGIRNSLVRNKLVSDGYWLRGVTPSLAGAVPSCPPAGGTTAAHGHFQGTTKARCVSKETALRRRVDMQAMIPRVNNADETRHCRHRLRLLDFLPPLLATFFCFVFHFRVVSFTATTCQDSSCTEKMHKNKMCRNIFLL